MAHLVSIGARLLKAFAEAAAISTATAAEVFGALLDEVTADSGAAARRRSTRPDLRHECTWSCLSVEDPARRKRSKESMDLFILSAIRVLSIWPENLRNMWQKKAMWKRWKRRRLWLPEI